MRSCCWAPPRCTASLQARAACCGMGGRRCRARVQRRRPRSRRCQGPAAQCEAACARLPAHAPAIALRACGARCATPIAARSGAAKRRPASARAAALTDFHHRAALLALLPAFLGLAPACMTRRYASAPAWLLQSCSTCRPGPSDAPVRADDSDTRQRLLRLLVFGGRSRLRRHGGCSAVPRWQLPQLL